VRSGGLAAATLVVAACAARPPAAPTAPAAPFDRITQTLFLLGDGGMPAPADPVLALLRDEVARAPGRSAVVFLGDNIYPAGLPPETAPDRSEAEARLGAQLDAARGAALVVFVPGNHDWKPGGAAGLEAVRRQARFIARRGGPAARLLPADGCPGPVQVADGPLRVAAIDTQWWLHDHPAPHDSTCPSDPGAVTGRLRAWLLADTARPAIVLGHHPLLTGGVHGGYFDWTDHVFPLTKLVPWLWLPLPVIGSAYPLARSLGISNQDLSAGAYRAMRDSLAAAFRSRPPLVYASGHEHNLQVLDGEAFGVQTQVVTGAAAYGHTSAVARLPITRYARRASGLIRLDVAAGGGVRLAVIVTDRKRGPREEYSEWLVPTEVPR
jgi:hypothetical protein